MKIKTNQYRHLFLLHVLLLLYSFGGVVSKTAASKPLFSPSFFFFYAIVLGILFLYAVLWQQILKNLPLTMAYANKAVTTIWGMLWGMVFFGEKLSLHMICGGLVIIAGIYLVVRSDD